MILNIDDWKSVDIAAGACVLRMSLSWESSCLLISTIQMGYGYGRPRSRILSDGIEFAAESFMAPSRNKYALEQQ